MANAIPSHRLICACGTRLKMPDAKSRKLRGNCPKCHASFQLKNGAWKSVTNTVEQVLDRPLATARPQVEKDVTYDKRRDVPYSINNSQTNVAYQQFLKENSLPVSFVPVRSPVQSTEKIVTGDIKKTAPKNLSDIEPHVESRGEIEIGQHTRPNDLVRKAIAKAIDSKEQFDPSVLRALTLAFHPWPDEFTVSPEVTSAIAAELLPSFNINHPDILEVAIDRLLRFAEAVSFEMANDLCNVYRDAADVLNNVNGCPNWCSNSDRIVGQLPLFSPLGVGVPKAYEAGNLNQNREDDPAFKEGLGEPWLPLINELLNASISQRTSDIGELCGGELAEITVEQLAIHFGIELPSADFDDYIRTLDSRSRDVLVSRTFNLHAPQTLVDVATRWGVTRQRVRQIEMRTKKELIAKFEKTFLKFGRRTILPMTTRLVRSEELSAAAKAIALNCEYTDCLAGVVLELFGPWKTIGNWKYHKSLGNKVSALKPKLVAAADDNGFIESDQITAVCESLFKDDLSRIAFLLSEFGFGCYFDQWMIKKTVRCQVLAALKSIGRPATKQEVSDLLNHPRNNVGSIFGNIPEVVRADRFRWGFREWIDDVYDGIVGEIEQRIEEFNGSVPLRHLLQEIPAMFNVAEGSVKAYIFSDAFAVENGMVRYASADDFKPLSPEQMPDAVRLNGSWGHKVRIYDRHLKGYSLGVHFDIAFANGLRPGDDLVVPLENHKEEVSLIWRAHSINRLVDVGRVGNFLSLQNYKDGDEVIIVPSRGSVLIVPFEIEKGNMKQIDDRTLETSEDEEFQADDPLLDLLGG